MTTTPKKGQVVKYSTPVNAVEAGFRFVLLDDPTLHTESDGLDIECTNSGLAFAPVDRVRLSDICAVESEDAI